MSKFVLAAVMLLCASQGFAQWDRGGRDDRGRGRGPDRGGQACFYEHANYTGRSFCLRSGETYRNLDGFFNDMISSISIDGNLRVTFYEDAHYRGRSMTIDRDLSNLDNYRGWNDKISSIIVEGDRDGGPGRGGPGRGGPGRGRR